MSTRLGFEPANPGCLLGMSICRGNCTANSPIHVSLFVSPNPPATFSFHNSSSVQQASDLGDLYYSLPIRQLTAMMNNGAHKITFTEGWALINI